ncbi:hypothetical protein X965_00495 [Morganella sp. EGD-HP17]|nr:hypothetical protein X965_00495 [Morganella sp. EGD-HP17]
MSGFFMPVPDACFLLIRLNADKMQDISINNK